MLISLSIILSSVTDIYEIFVQDNYDFYILKLLNSFSVGGAMTPPPLNNPPPLRAPHCMDLLGASWPRSAMDLPH